MMTALLIFAAGILIGVPIGVMLDDAFDMLRKENVHMHAPSLKNTWAVLIIISLLMNALVGVLLWRTRVSAEDYYSCMAQWQQDFAKATQVRQDANEPVQNAIDAIVTAVAKRDNAAAEQAVIAYVSLRNEQKAAKAKNPYPPLPDTVCGNADGTRR